MSLIGIEIYNYICRKMTQKIKSWKEKVSIFFQNCAKKELETEKETAKQNIIHILIKEKTTQETIEIYKDISKELKSILNNRYESISKEKEAIEEFFKD